MMTCRPIYRAYIRDFNGRVFHKTITESPVAAEAAFRELMLMREYWATCHAAVLSLDNRQLEFRRFDRIIPIDEDLAKRLKYKKQLPDLPRFVLPLDLKTMPEDADETNCILCYMAPYAYELPIFDPEKPIRLRHDDPYI